MLSNAVSGPGIHCHGAVPRQLWSNFDQIGCLLLVHHRHNKPQAHHGTQPARHADQLQPEAQVVEAVRAREEDIPAE